MRRYLVVIERAGGTYSAHVPDLPGCVVTGATAEETMLRMRAAAAWLEAARAEGKPIPAPRCRPPQHKVC